MNKRQMYLMSIPMGTVLPKKMFDEVLTVLLSEEENEKKPSAILSSEHDDDVVGLNDESHPLAAFVRAVINKLNDS